MTVARQLGVLAVLAAVALGAYAGWRALDSAQSGRDPGDRPRGGRGPPLVETARAEVRDLETRVDAVGTTRARRAVEITPLAPGRVTEITFHAGQRVEAGEVLLRLDDDIERADLVEARARLTEARGALERAQSLKQSRAIPEETVDRLVAALATAQANLHRTERRVRDRTVTAPFAGTVGFSRVELGGRVEDGDTVTTLDDLSSVEIEFALPEALFGRIDVGQRVLADAAAYPARVFDGEIRSIDSRVDPVGRSFKARAVVGNPDRALPAGMFMHLAVVLDARRALTVPEEAVLVDGGGAYLFAVVEGEDGPRAERRDVTVGQRSFGHVEIVAGVEPGEEVVVRGLQRVRDRASVRREGQAGSGAGERGRGRSS